MRGKTKQPGRSEVWAWPWLCLRHQNWWNVAWNEGEGAAFLLLNLNFPQVRVKFGALHEVLAPVPQLLFQKMLCWFSYSGFVGVPTLVPPPRTSCTKLAPSVCRPPQACKLGACPQKAPGPSCCRRFRAPKERNRETRPLHKAGLQGWRPGQRQGLQLEGECGKAVWTQALRRRRPFPKPLGEHSQSGGHGSLGCDTEARPLFIPQVTSTWDQSFPSRNISISQQWPRTVVKEKCHKITFL